jgi:PatG C-terminal
VVAESGDVAGQVNDGTQESVIDRSEDGSGSASEPAVVAAVAPLEPVPPPAPAFVYALGQIEARFPSLSVEKEFAQAIGDADYAGLTDRQTMKRAISERSNRYLARSVCWVFVIEGLETYILVPRDPGDVELLIDAYREEASGDDLDVVIGTRGPLAPPTMCNGLVLPIVTFDQVYSFDRYTLIEAIPTPDGIKDDDVERFRSAAGELFDQLLQVADNAGAIDEHRALNYLAVRYPRIYTVTKERIDENFSLAGIEVVPSPLTGVRSIVDVVFSYRNRGTDVVEKQFVRVDVTEEFPFLASKMGPYYDR